MIKGVGETIENEGKEEKRGFLKMLVATLGTSFLSKVSIGKGFIRAGEGTISVGQDF